MSIKENIRKVLKKVGILEKVIEIKHNIDDKKKLTKKYTFENRMKNKEKVCFILAGYKPFLYDIVFKRIKAFVPDDVEVCILSSGIYSDELSKIAKNNDWSYLSTKRNSVSLVQNVGINLFDSAEYIYKIDEDMFITKGFFEMMMKTYVECEDNSLYKVGVVAPTIPINGFGMTNILNRFDLVDIYREKFEEPKRVPIRTSMIDTNPSVAKFFWGENKYVPQIDEMNKIVQKDKLDYEICPIRFSIGAIMFKRKFWQDMRMFNIPEGSGLGSDEVQICEFCMSHSQPIVVSKNSIVGHLSFGPQNEEMKKYFLKNKKLFDLN